MLTLQALRSLLTCPSRRCRAWWFLLSVLARAIAGPTISSSTRIVFHSPVPGSSCLARRRWVCRPFHRVYRNLGRRTWRSLQTKIFGQCRQKYVKRFTAPPTFSERCRQCQCIYKFFGPLESGSHTKTKYIFFFDFLFIYSLT
jgi:hypothetical protein